jgi:hypothetical protein
MKRFTPIVHLFGLLWLAGCASFSTDPKLVGTYSAENSEELVFMSDGRVFHVQTANGKVDRFFLGYYASSSNSPFQLEFAGPDTSPFIGTSFQFNADGSTVNASWGKFYEPKGAWQVTYRKVSKPN